MFTYEVKFIVMNIKQWLKATKKHMSDRQAVLDEVDRDMDQMYQLAGNFRKPGAPFCRKFVAAVAKHTPYALVSLAELRPDIWGDDEVKAA